MRLASLLALAVLATGCASSPLKQYPTFPERYAATEGTRVLADVTVLEDVGGGTDQVTISTSQEVGESLSETLSEILQARGYRVDRVYEPAVGLYTRTPEPVRVRLTREAADSLETAPFLIPEAVYQDTTFLLTLDGALARDAGAPADLPDARTAEAFVLLTAQARRVPLEKSCVQGVATGLLTTLLTGGLVSAYAYETSTAILTLDVVDGASGDVIWHDEALLNGEAGDTALRQAVRKMARRLPERAALVSGSPRLGPEADRAGR